MDGRMAIFQTSLNFFLIANKIGWGGQSVNWKNWDTKSAIRFFDTVLNLVGNAIEACADTTAATVLLKTEYLEEKGQIVLSIIDNGPGIPRDIRESIFDAFFSTKGSKGTGLGLAIAREIVEEHGGKLELISEIGEGTTFRVILPLNCDEKKGDQI